MTDDTRGTGRTASGALIESVAKAIYEQWVAAPGYVRWVDGGNSANQDDARWLARKALEEVEALTAAPSADKAEAVAWRFKDLAGNTHYADHVSSLAQSEITPLFAAPPTALLREVMGALTLAKKGLAFYLEVMPKAGRNAHDEAEERIDAALAKLREQLGEL